jgi:hypothetical protein
MVAETGQLNEDADGRGDAEVAPSEASIAVGSGVLPDSGSEGTGLVGSQSLITGLLKLRNPECQPFV